MNGIILSGVGVAMFGALWYSEYLFTSFTVLVHLMFATVGIYLGLSWSLLRGKQYTPPPLPPELQHPHISLLLQNMMEARAGQRAGPKKVVISRNMDLALQEVIDLVLRDFVVSWYKTLSLDQEGLLSQLQSDLWIMIGQISERLSKVDTVQFVTQDVVDKLQIHFQDIRLANKKAQGEESAKKFMLHPWLHSEQMELNFLRKISEAFLLVVLPKPYAKSTPIRHLLREVVANTVLKPTIELICDPDYINLTLISYIEYREKLSEDTRRTYTYAPTYEEFVKMIDKCEDIEQLKQLRLNIMTEIMQATTINNLKKRQSIPDKPGSPKAKSTGKGELLKARNLKKYINQLTVAKSRSEKRIHRLGGRDYKYYIEDVDEKTGTLPGQKVLSFAEIMESSAGRDCLDSFLKRDDNHSLLGFWNGVENLKEADKRQHHHIAADLHQRFISSNTSVVRVDKAIAKGIENFMLGNSGPEAFYEAQGQVYCVLEEQHYPSFLVSDVYHRYVTSMEDGGHDASGAVRKDELFFEPNEGLSDEDDELEMFSAQSYHAKQKLQQLDQKIINKTQAVEALRVSVKADSKDMDSSPSGQKLSPGDSTEPRHTGEKFLIPWIQKVVDEELEKELECMKIEKRNLESHIIRTETWCENVGRWRSHVYEVAMTNESDKRVPLFVLVIHLSGSSNTSQNLQNSSQGWVVNRKLQDFYGVHEKLVQIAGSWLKNKELPKIGRFTTVDTRFLKEAKATLNEYLSTVMKDERLAQSEALYGFLTPTPEYFQQPGQEKKSGFFLKNLLKSLPSIGQDNRVPDEELLLFSGDDRAEDRSKDSIAEPLYRLISEVYELHGMFKWLRKSFIAFVEISFGKSINRQLRETVHWIFSEPMIIYYIRMFKDSMWPHGVLAESLPTRTDEEKLKTRVKAKEKFLLNQPDAVKTLVGEENARRGTIKMFEVLQDVRLNKQLFYVLLQLLLVHMIPELGAVFNQDRDQDERDQTFVINSSEVQT